MSGIIKEYSHDFFLTAGECNAHRQMPLTLLTQRVIEVATEHANILGVGYADLIKDNQAWVLSRLTIEMKSYPEVNQNYRFTTWIENYNRHFSERNFEICGNDGSIIGYVRTIWVAIDITTRTAGDLSKMISLVETVSDRPCPIERQARMRPITEPATENTYRFRYCDIDFNRHVNSVRYMELLLNQWDLEYHDTHPITRFEISYQHEARYGEEAIVKVSQSENIADTEIIIDGKAVNRSRITFKI